MGRPCLGRARTTTKGGSYDEGKADATYDGRRAVSTTFYLDRNGNISSMNGNYIHLFSVKDFESPKAVSAYMQEINRAWTNEIKGWGSSASRKSEKEKLKKLLDFLKPYASGKKPIDNPEELLWQFRKLHKSMFGCDTENNFINIKTGEKTFASIRHNIKESRKKDSGGNGWYRVLDVTDAIGPDGKLDRDLLVKAIYKGDSGKHHRDEEGYLNGLKKLYEKMIDEKNLVYRDGDYFDPKGEKEYLERDHEL